ncbi:hypothetical protein [Ferrimonas balearica]|uniref:hypothetical protein n=1 Tax=Ferrimonas balearica TaxID=44012 RepID=UPI001C98EB0C|nr:hypothetical protein [Ferrimonas balearica]MBY5922641.1 hypothetical protein [Ferrimonas balearica]MBY5995625.1 hypothetical protein [Ferrimonas balearica]
MALEPILIFVALITLYLAYKSRQFQKEHKAANERAEAKLNELEAEARKQCQDWASPAEPDHDAKAALKAGLMAAFEFGSGLKGEPQKPDSRVMRTLLGDYLEGAEKAHGHETWALYHRALHCAVLLGQAASQPKMAERIAEQEKRLRTALKVGQAPLSANNPANPDYQEKA